MTTNVMSTIELFKQMYPERNIATVKLESDELKMYEIQTATLHQKVVGDVLVIATSVPKTINPDWLPLTLINKTTLEFHQKQFEPKERGCSCKCGRISCFWFS